MLVRYDRQRNVEITVKNLRKLAIVYKTAIVYLFIYLINSNKMKKSASQNITTSRTAMLSRGALTAALEIQHIKLYNKQKAHVELRNEIYTTQYTVRTKNDTQHQKTNKHIVRSDRKLQVISLLSGKLLNRLRKTKVNYICIKIITEKMFFLCQ